MSDEKPVKIDIISGFLGAGKTTLINKLLTEAYTGERVALLENEFGEIGIDGDLVRKDKIAVKELANGCICCSLQNDFIDGINQLARQYKPDRIIIEPTGIAQFRDIIDRCREAVKQNPSLELNAVISVVNAPSYPALINVGGEFFTLQIAHAWFIALSAVQGIPCGEMGVEEIVSSIWQINPGVAVNAQAWDSVDALALLSIAEQITAEKAKSAHYKTDCFCHHHHTDEWTSFSFILSKAWNEEKVSAFENILRNGEYGEIFRSKGFIPFEQSMMRFDYVYGISKLDKTDYSGSGKLVVIGKNIKTDALKILVSDI